MNRGNTVLHPFELYTDSRTHGYQGPSRYVRLSHVTSTGGGSAIAKSEDGTRCVVSGKESLRILKISTPSHESTVEEGGNRIDVSHNLWDGSGLKIDSANTDVAWGSGKFNNKILTSARNGELIMWDINKSGNTKYERRSKDHTRSINKLSISHIVHHYCITGSVEGDLRVWDLRDMTKSLMRVRHPSSVRSLVFSSSAWQPLQSIVGLDNGSIYRWDLKMGQRGQLDRLHVAHRASVTTLDWCPVGGISSSTTNIPAVPAHEESSSGGLGWIVSGGMDKTVKVWNLTNPGSNTHIPHKPTYILHPSFPVRKVAWRPGYECELAIVSNVEYMTPADFLQQSPHTPSNAPPSRVGAIALDALMKRTSVVNLAKERPVLFDTTDALAPSVAGDAIEIWDVRRGWIAKWSVSGSGTECGVSASDITFRDSHAIWTQHISGAFTQFDLRETTKAPDAIPRVALSWEPAGSVAFVVDDKLKWEVPYDDIKPKSSTNTEATQPPLKALGDPPARIKTQVAASYAHDLLIHDLEIFTALAKRYIFDGKNRQEICVHNSGVASAVGNDAAAQVWSLLGAAMSDYLPGDTQTSANSASNDSEKKNQNAENPASNFTEYAFPVSLSGGYARDASSHQKISPGRSTGGSIIQMPSHSVSRRQTPASSASPSPRHPPVSLPLITPRRPSVFTGRNSADTGRVAIPRQPSITPGSSNAHSHSASPSNRSTPRHVGEGVLDSDSSSSGSDGDGEGDETAGVNSTDDETRFKPHTLLGPGAGSTTSSVHKPLTIPSPVSRVSSNQVWSGDVDEFKRVHGENGDEDDLDTSPSPQSTSDTETDSTKSISSRKVLGLRSRSHSSSIKQMKRTSISRLTKSRSRSSTVASLAALPQRPKPLMHQDSHSSIRTVTAGETPHNDQCNGDIRADLDLPGQNKESRLGHSRQKSAPISESMLNSRKKGANSKDHEKEDEVFLEKSCLSERRIELIRTDDQRFKLTTLIALREALEEFAEEGDIQMCSMLALVADKELGISRSRVTRFVESYIEILIRFRLHHCAAYVRKFCDIRDVRKKTLLETTIYSSCGRCRKPLAVPAGSSWVGKVNRGQYAYCLSCQAHCVVCSICHIPVQTMLFQCPICNHGGHQACYRDYYMQYPMFDLPTTLSSPINRGRQLPTQSPLSIIEDDSASTISLHGAVEASIMQNLEEPSQTAKLKGHPCAAGCGHFCWAINGHLNF